MSWTWSVLNKILNKICLEQDPLDQLVSLDEVDESVGGGVVGGHRVLVVQLRLDGFGKLFSQLNSGKEKLKRLF